ncbi:TIGR00153 family protein [Parahalioglobus pacificus]|uniref:TIGR00153 family protein n=1 Tax=Parahalioglobus pacificus TaxID=930806 RepID=A0A919CLD4_9GAMM|nr:TIGR00153 family protein [Halioglobus pacificus]GHD34492.1 TIGR00153 family protein [Halioglobus pacificus]
MAGGNPLERLFGKSPIGPIQEHMQLANEAACLLPQLIEASIDGDWKRAKEVNKQIQASEAAADKLKRKIRQNLPRSLFLPVPRGDLLELVSTQDKVANVAKDIGVLVMGREMTFPAKLQEPLTEFLDACLSAVDQCLGAIQELDELLEVGFTGREVRRVEKMLKDLDRTEAKCDRTAAKVRRILFRMESELPPIDTMFLYRVLALISDLADVSESVGDRLQIIIAR